MIVFYNPLAAGHHFQKKPFWKCYPKRKNIPQSAIYIYRHDAKIRGQNMPASLSRSGFA